MTITIICHYANGQSITTRFNGSVIDATHYYIGKEFNIGAGGYDNMQRCLNIEHVPQHYAAVYVYGGCLNHVEISEDYEALKAKIFENLPPEKLREQPKMEGFDPDDDCVQIWDDAGQVVFNYETDVYDKEMATND